MSCPCVAFRGCQVPLQRPSPKRLSTTGGSPFENLPPTDPLTIGLPQSSTTRTSTGFGHPVGRLKFPGKEVKRGSSFVGVHSFASRKNPCRLYGEPPGAPSGHDFSRAESAAKSVGASAPEGSV